MGEPIDPNAFQPTFPPPSPHPAHSYPGQPYPAQPYPAQPYPAQPYPAPQFPTPGAPPLLTEAPAPDHSRRWMIVVAIVVVVLGVTVAVSLASGSTKHTPSTPLPLPAALGPYPRDQSAVVDRVRQGMVAGQHGGAVANFLKHAQLAVYTPGGSVTDSTVILVTGRPADYPSIVDSILTQQDLGSMNDPVIITPGDNGGNVDCATVSDTGVQETICAWQDSTSVGIIVALGTDLTPTQLGDVTSTARDTIDH